MDNNGKLAVSKFMFLMWLFFLIVLMTLFVALTVGDAFSSKQDIRSMEASILYKQISECISRDGMVPLNFTLENCFLKDEDLYASVNINSSDGRLHKFVETGDISMRLYAEVCKNKEGKYPYCMKQNQYVLIANESKLERGTMEVSIAIKKYDLNI